MMTTREDSISIQVSSPFDFIEQRERGIKDLHHLSIVGPKTNAFTENEESKRKTEKGREERERERKEQNAKPLDSFHRLTPLTVIVQSSNRKVGAKKKAYTHASSFFRIQIYLSSSSLSLLRHLLHFFFHSHWTIKIKSTIVSSMHVLIKHRSLPIQTIIGEAKWKKTKTLFFVFEYKCWFSIDLLHWSF